MKRSYFLLAALQPALVGLAFASGNELSAIALHIAPATSMNSCTLPGLFRDLINVDSNELTDGPDGPFFFVYVLGCNGSQSSGISGLDFRIYYHGSFSPSGGGFPTNVFDWHLCADSNTSDALWPSPGTNNLIQWAPGNCQTTLSQPPDPQSVIAIAGYFYVGAYGPGNIQVMPRSDSLDGSVIDCSGNAFGLIGAPAPPRFGIAGFQGSGYNPCLQGIIPVEPTTWGGIKSAIRH